MNSTKVSLRDWADEVLPVAKAAAKGTNAGVDLVAMLEASPPWRLACSGVQTVAVHLPLLVHSAIRGDHRPALKLSAAILLFEAGVYALDHFMDRELQPPLDQWAPGAIVLGATSLISYVPQHILANLDGVDDARSLAMLRRLTEGMALIGQGQALDIGSGDAVAPSPHEIEQAVLGKSGERRALYAALACRLAGADEKLTRGYTEYARALGMARQLNSDLLDIFGTSASRDLSSGVKTLPVALFLHREQGERRQQMLQWLEQSRNGDSRQLEISQLLRESGDMRTVLRHKEGYCRRALRFLAEVAPMEPARQELMSAVESISLSRESGRQVITAVD